MKTIARALVALAALVAPGVVSASHSPAHALAAKPEAPLVSGEVRRIDKDAGRITLKHDAIPNLAMTPMTMVSGVFFPAEQLPKPVLAVAQLLPLYHGVELVRPLVAGRLPSNVALHIAVLLVYAAAGSSLTIMFARRRFSA